MRPEVIITGVGVTSAIGQGARAFSRGLFEAPNAFGVTQRPGRQKASSFLGAEIPSVVMPPGISPQHLRNASLTAQAGLVTLHEAWSDARLSDADPIRIGLIIGGSNLQQRSQVQTYEAYSERTQFLRPTYGLSFMDTDLCGLCTEQFGIRGLAYTVGGASASGQLAYHPNHRWFYFPDLQPDEVLVFMSFDFEAPQRRRVMHSAFEVPNHPPGAHRTSIEGRAFAFFEI